MWWRHCQYYLGRYCRILDARADCDMAGDHRDDIDGCDRLFQFKNNSDLNPCKAAILAQYQNAFAVAPGGVAVVMAGLAAADLLLSRPMYNCTLQNL